MKLQTLPAGVGFWCPACRRMHFLLVCHQVSADTDHPTITPDLVVEDDDLNYPARCHCEIADGQIHFFPDSTHALAGQTVPMSEIPARLRSA